MKIKTFHSFPFDPPHPSGVYIPEDIDPNSSSYFLMPRLLTTSAILVMNMQNLRKRNIQQCTAITNR